MWAVIFFESKNIQQSILGYFTTDEFNNLHWHEINDPFISGAIINDMKQVGSDKLFGSSKGLIYFNSDKYTETQSPWNINITEISIDDSITFGNPEFGNFKINMNYGQSIRFNFSAKVHHNIDNENEYRTRIIGYSNDWSSYEKIPFKEFEKLPHGRFTLEVQGRNAFFNESEIIRLEFIINPPWYFSTYAYIGYALLALIIIFLSAKISTYRIQQKNKQLELLISERTNEIAQQNELLEEQKSEIESKNEDILDSIKYAKRIQDTILPTDDKLESLIGEHFVFFQPKDIVSGGLLLGKKN
jgi:hypothetical protein